MFPIQCEDSDLTKIHSAFPRQVSHFPCRYLGLPLQISRTQRVDEQILIDKIGAMLPDWKGRLLNKAGRLTLATSGLSSIPTYYMTMFPLSKWAIEHIDTTKLPMTRG